MSDTQTKVKNVKTLQYALPSRKTCEYMCKKQIDVYSKRHNCGVHTVCAPAVCVEVGLLAFSGVVC